MSNTGIPCKHVVEADAEKRLFEDEVLESIWEFRERKGTVLYADVLDLLGHEDRLRQMQADELIGIDNGAITLTQRGHDRSRDLIRRHRLAERLFADVLDIKDFEEDACRIEHAISSSVEEAICTLLGHPPRCPHGKEIPRGNCCSIYTRKVKPLVQSLKELEVGKDARVLFINNPAIDRLATMGLVPGSTVRLLQKRPSFVIEIDQTTVAIDEDIARGIYVKQQ